MLRPLSMPGLRRCRSGLRPLGVLRVGRRGARTRGSPGVLVAVSLLVGDAGADVNAVWVLLGLELELMHWKQVQVGQPGRER